MYDPSVPTAAEQAAGYTDNEDFEFLELVQPLQHAADADQLLHRQRRGLHLRLDSGRHARRIVNLGERGHRHLDQRHLGGRHLHGLRRLQPQRTPPATRGTLTIRRQYTITYPGGSSNVVLDQGTAVNGQLNLGQVTTNAAGQIQVQLTRQSTAKETHWTLANQVEFVASGRGPEGGQPGVDFHVYDQRTLDAGPRRLRGAGERLRGLQLPLQRGGQPHSGGGPVHGPSRQRRREDEPLPGRHARCRERATFRTTRWTACITTTPPPGPPSRPAAGRP